MAEKIVTVTIKIPSLEWNEKYAVDDVAERRTCLHVPKHTHPPNTDMDAQYGNTCNIYLYLYIYIDFFLSHIQPYTEKQKRYP